MKMKLMENEKKYLQQKFSRKVLVDQTKADFISRVRKSYVPFTCKFPMLMHFLPILHKLCMSNTNFYYDKTCFKFCASFKFSLAVFTEKFKKKNRLSELCEKRNRGGSRAGKKVTRGLFFNNLLHS